MPHTNVELIRRFYDARAAGDRRTIREILAPDVRWHDPYPPPHGGDLQGVDAVLADVFDAAGELTGGTTRLAVRDVIASDTHALVLIDWSTEYRGRSMAGTEAAVYRIVDERVTEVWFFPEDPAASDAFFAG